MNYDRQQVTHKDNERYIPLTTHKPQFGERHNNRSWEQPPQVLISHCNVFLTDEKQLRDLMKMMITGGKLRLRGDSQ